MGRITFSENQQLLASDLNAILPEVETQILDLLVKSVADLPVFFGESLEPTVSSQIARELEIKAGLGFQERTDTTPKVQYVYNKTDKTVTLDEQASGTRIDLVCVRSKLTDLAAEARLIRDPNTDTSASQNVVVQNEYDNEIMVVKNITSGDAAPANYLALCEVTVDNTGAHSIIDRRVVRQSLPEDPEEIVDFLETISKSGRLVTITDGAGNDTTLHVLADENYLKSVSESGGNLTFVDQNGDEFTVNGISDDDASFLGEWTLDSGTYKASSNIDVSGTAAFGDKTTIEDTDKIVVQETGGDKKVVDQDQLSTSTSLATGRLAISAVSGGSLPALTTNTIDIASLSTSDATALSLSGGKVTISRAGKIFGSIFLSFDDLEEETGTIEYELLARITKSDGTRETVGVSFNEEVDNRQVTVPFSFDVDSGTVFDVRLRNAHTDAVDYGFVDGGGTINLI